MSTLLHEIKINDEQIWFSPYVLDLRTGEQKGTLQFDKQETIVREREGSGKTRKNASRSIIGWAIYIGFVFGLVWGLPVFLSWKLNTAYPIAAITSGSMWPELSRGDLVVIRGVQNEELAVGDIVVWSSGGGFTIHRIIEIREDGVVTKGDANFDADAPVSFDRIVGRAIEREGKALSIPYLGYVSIIGSDVRQNFL